MFGKLFNNLKNGLTKTRNALTDKINEALNLAVTIDDDLYEELEEISVVTKDGKHIILIKDGRFVLPGTEILNEPLKQLEN